MSKVTVGHPLSFDRREFQVRWVVWDQVPALDYATRLLEVHADDPEFAAFMSDKPAGQEFWVSPAGMILKGAVVEYIGMRGTSWYQFKLDFMK